MAQADIKKWRSEVRVPWAAVGNLVWPILASQHYSPITCQVAPPSSVNARVPLSRRGHPPFAGQLGGSMSRAQPRSAVVKETASTFLPPGIVVARVVHVRPASRVNDTVPPDR